MLICFVIMVHHFTSVCHTGLCSTSARGVTTAFSYSITLHKESILKGQPLDKGKKISIGNLTCGNKIL